MIVADTNLISEPLRPAPDPGVLDWINSHAEQLALTSITIGELFSGAQKLPQGTRRTRLLEQITLLANEADARILAYGDSEARAYATIRAGCEAKGRTISVEDAMIAAICLTTQSPLATRNVRDFEHTGVTILNPWQPR